MSIDDALAAAIERTGDFTLSDSIDPWRHDEPADLVRARANVRRLAGDPHGSLPPPLTPSQRN